MKLTKLLERLDYKVVAGSDNIEITELVNDSRKVVPDSAFVCISGAVSDGHQYVKRCSRKKVLQRLLWKKMWKCQRD